MTSQPEDKFAAILGNYDKIYESSFGSPPPRGGEQSPSSDPENSGLKRLEEGRVDSRDMREEDESRRGSGQAGGPAFEDDDDAAGVEAGKETAGIRGEQEEAPQSTEDGPSGTDDRDPGVAPIPPTSTSTSKSLSKETPPGGSVGSDTEKTDHPGSVVEETPSRPERGSDISISDSISGSGSGSDSDDDTSSGEETTPDGEADYDDAQSRSRSRSGSEDFHSAVYEIGSLIRSGGVKNIIVLAGAGISTSAGIPDFRSPKTGLYANLAKFDLPHPEAIFDIGFFRRKPEPFYVLCKDLYPGKHLPTATHYFFRLLQEKGKLLRIFTQNIDTLERIAGIPSEKIVEAHGSFASSHCIQCHAEVAEGEMRRAVEQHAGKPVRCGECGGLVKPDIVFFGEGLPERFFERASRDLPKCDLLITIGTSLQVQPFASLVEKVSATCPRLLINRELVGEATGRYDRGFRFTPGSRDRFYKGDADAGAVDLAKELGWENELEQMIETQQGELRTRWGLDKPERESSAETSSSPDETIDKLARELEQAGL